MGNLEACARKEAQNELENRYRQQGLEAAAAKLQAQADLNALDGYFQAGQFEPRDRIQFLTGLAVGLATNQVTIPEWRKELAAICGIRARASAGAIGTCDEAFKNNGFGGRAAYMGGSDCPPNSLNLIRCDPNKAPLASKNATLINRADRNHLGDWLFGKGGYDMSNNKITGSGVGGQLDSRTQAGISKNSQQAFYSIHQACIRGRNQAVRGNDGSSLSVSANGPSVEGGFGIGGYGIGGKVDTTIFTANLTETQGNFGVNFDPPQVTSSVGLGYGLSGSTRGGSMLVSNRSGYSGDKIALSLPLPPPFSSLDVEIGDQGYVGVGFSVDDGVGVSGSLVFVPGAAGCR